MKHLKYYVILLLFSQSIFSRKNTIVKLNSVEIVLPGKWKYLGSNKTSGQHTFENEKTKVGVFISVREKTKLEFYNDSLSDFALVKAFYKWDSEYWNNSEKTITLIKEEESDNNRRNWFSVYPAC